MDINDYQNKALKSAFYTGDNIIPDMAYLGLGVAGEAGEVADKIKKFYRDKPKTPGDIAKSRVGIAKEIGDNLWYLSTLAAKLGFTMEEICKMNLEKISDRASNGTQHGEGDDR